jgi:hypothetical protein
LNKINFNLSNQQSLLVIFLHIVAVDAFFSDSLINGAEERSYRAEVYNCAIAQNINCAIAQKSKKNLNLIAFLKL